MPTGYTSKVKSGECTDFVEYAMSCARAFGACIMMRDDPADAKIPDRFEPSDYHQKRLDELRAERSNILAANDEGLDNLAICEYERLWSAWEERTQERQEGERRYRAMLEKARAYKPPTADHQQYAAFLVSQLEKSIELDCSNEFDAKPELLSGRTWARQKLDKIDRDIEYHTKEHAAEVERANGRTLWVQQLRESLGVPVGH